MIHTDKCLELGLPEPRGETQLYYCVKAMKMGAKLDTRICRYIGIHNLHSIVSKMRRKHIPFTLEHKRAICPFTHQLRPELVDHIYMDGEQRKKAQTTSDQTNEMGLHMNKINHTVSDDKSQSGLNIGA